MPTSTRKSSVGTAARRGPQKAHIPFNADDLEHGKKTGFAVDYVEHQSDDFEPFEQVISQADKRTPPRVRRGRKKKTRDVIESPLAEEDEHEFDYERNGHDEDDGGGEMSMELDDSNPGSPTAYLANARVAAHNSTTRTVLSNRSAPRVSDFYDKVPSPRPSAHSQAQARARARSSFAPSARASHPGPGSSSALSQSVHPTDDHDDMNGGMDGYDPPENDSPEQVGRTSFTDLSRYDGNEGKKSEVYNDNDMDEEEDEPMGNLTGQSTSKRDKGKGRPARVLSPQPDDMEDEIAQGLQDLSHSREEDSETEQARPPAKKSRSNNKAEASERPQSKPRSKSIKIVEPTRSSSPDNPDGIRRSKRHRYRPLEWWRQEKVIYGRREHGISFVPHIKEIIRIPKEPVQPLGKYKRKRSQVPRGGSKAGGEEGEGGEGGDGEGGEEGEGQVVLFHNPEEGWDDQTNPYGVVLDYDTLEEVSRRIAFTAKMVDPKAAANNDWFFQKVFGDGNFIAAGQLVIPPKSRKPSKGTKDNTYVFYVIEGAVNLKVHNTSLILATGGMFLVPRGNTYLIENIADRDAKLFFTQARKIPLGDEEEHTPAARRTSGARLSQSVPAQNGEANAVQ